MALKDYLRVSQLSEHDLERLLDLSVQLKRAPHLNADLLKHEAVALYFAKPSTRTRVSFVVAVSRLGGVPEVLGPGDLQLGRGETIEDTARVLSRYVKAVVIRTFADEDVERFAAAATVPVVNALTDGHHPCQALADLLTLREHFGGLAGLTLTYLGDGNNVAHSLIEAGALAGMNVVVSTPEGYEPDSAVVEAAQAVAARTRGSVEVVRDPFEAVVDADALYTDVWLSMGDDPATKDARYRALRPYQVNEELMAAAAPEAVFLHCLPAHRGDEVTAEVIDGPRSLVFDEAENRLYTEQAVLLALLKGLLQGVC